MNRFPKLLVPLVLVAGLLFPGFPSPSAFASEVDNDSVVASSTVDTPSDQVVATDAVEPVTDGELKPPEELTTGEFTELAEPLVALDSEGAVQSRAGPNVPSEADGTKIETVSVKWLTEDEDGVEDHLRQVWTDNSPQIIRARINFALSGQNDYEPGTVSIRIPKDVVKDRFGKWASQVTLGIPQSPSVSGLFAYTESGNEILITNTKKLVAAASGMIEISWRNLIPSEIKDYATGYKTEPFSAELTVSTHAGSLIAKTSNTIEADFDTKAEINTAYKRYDGGMSGSYPASWPTELKPTNPDDFYYAQWTVWASSKANQYYRVDYTDNAKASTDARNAQVLGFVHSRDGKIIKGSSGTIVDNAYYPDGVNFSGRVYVAYPKEDFPDNRTYYLTNTISFTMTGVDDKQTSSTSASATLPFSPLKVTFPDGNFIVHKNGDGQTETYVAGKVEGIYPTALNSLLKGKNVDTTFDVDVFARGGAWTLKDGGNPELFSDYGAKNYTVVVEDDTTTFNYGPELTTEDFEFRALTIGKPRVENFIPYLKGTVDNPKTGTVFTVNNKAAFNYELLPDSNIPDVRVFGKVSGGQYQDYGVVSFKSGTPVVTPKNGATSDGGSLIFPANVSDYKVEATTTAARIQWEMKPTVRMKPTASVLKQVNELYKSAIMPMTRVSNEVEMNVLVDNSTRNLFINRDIGRNQLMGFSHGANLTKTLTDYQSDAESQTVDLSYKLEATIQTNMTSREDLSQAVKDGLYLEQTTGTFYDLLPRGVVPDTGSVKLRQGDRVKDVRLYENYKGSGRILMVVKADLSPNYLYDPNLYNKPNILKTPGYYDRPTLTFNARYSWYSLADYGADLDNYAAFESGNVELGNVVGLSGEPDNPQAGRNSFSQYVVAQADTLTNLNPDTDNKSFVYSKADSKIVVDTNTLTQLFKQVDVNNEGAWSDGLENLLPKNVFEGGTYTYALRLKSTEVAKTTEMVFYDKLEAYTPTADKKDHGDTQWRGTFDSIDVSPMVEAGVKPVVYYSTKQGLTLDNTDDRSDNDLTNKTIWSTAVPEDRSTITAIAVDARKAADGSNFILPAGESISSFVKMRAPVGQDGWYDTRLGDGESEAGLTGGAHAYNNVSLLNKTISVDTGATSDLLLVRYDYVKVGLKPYSVNVTKAWDDDSNRDGLRADTVTVRLYGNGEDTGRKLNLNEANGWSGTFEQLPYLNDAGERIFYTVGEDPVNGYTFDPGVAASTDDGFTFNSVNHHTPKMVNVSGEKLWEGNAALPASIRVGLYKNDDLYRTIVVKPDREGKWLFSFDSLYAFENGEEIKWSVREVDYVKGFIQKVENFTITNVYDPYGSVKLGKRVEGQTAKAKQLNPDFTFVFTVFNADGTLNSEDFTWTSTNGRSGTISSGGTLTVKADEYATIERVPSDVRYTVKEVDLPAGYSLFKVDGLMDGALQAGETNVVTFVNRYKASGKVAVNGMKHLSGRNAKVGEFSFVLTDESGREVGSSYNGLGGLLMFGSLSYTEADDGKTFTYRIVEKNSGRGGVTYDSHTEEFTVKVSDNGDGTMTAEPTFDADGVVFSNEYHASGEVKLKAWKALKGGFKPQDGQFNFEVVNGEGKVVATGRNDASGVIEFTPLTFNETTVGQTLTFITREVAGSDATMNYDKSTVTYTIKPYDNGDGTLSFDAYATDNKVDDANNDPTTPLFVNEFKPGSLTVSKSVISGDQNKEFRFRAVLKGPDGLPEGEFELKREPNGDLTSMTVPGGPREFRLAGLTKAVANVASVLVEKAVRHLVPTADLNSTNSVTIILDPGDGTGTPVVLRQSVGGSVNLPKTPLGWSKIEGGEHYEVIRWNNPNLFEHCTAGYSCSIPGRAGDVVRLTAGWVPVSQYAVTFEQKWPSVVGSSFERYKAPGDTIIMPSTPSNWSLTENGYKYGVFSWEVYPEIRGIVGKDPQNNPSGFWTSNKFFTKDSLPVMPKQAKTTGAVLGATGGGTLPTCGFGVWTTDGYFLVKPDGATTKVNLPGQVKGAVSNCPLSTWSYVWTTDGYFRVNSKGSFTKIPVTGTIQGIIGTEHSTGVWTTDGYFIVSSLGKVTKTQVTGAVKGAIGSSPSSLIGGSAVWTTDGYFLVQPSGAVWKASITGNIVGASGDNPLVNGSLVWTDNKAYFVNDTGSVSPAPFTGAVIDAVGADFLETNDAAIAYSLVWATDGLYYRGIVNKKIDVPGEIRGIYGFDRNDSYASAYVWTTEGLYSVNAEGILGPKIHIPADIKSIIGSNRTSFGILAANKYYYRGVEWTEPPTEIYSAGDAYTLNSDVTFFPLWEPMSYKVNFNLSGAPGSIQPAFYDKGATVTLPTPPILPLGKKFVGWSATQGGEPISNPVDLAAPETETTLYAVWTDVDNTVNIQDGEFTFTLFPAEKVTLPNVPAGTTYEVYEETEAGWVLVSEENTSGTILANTDSLASFTNEYAPGKTQVKLGGRKTVDGVSTDAGGFTFNLFEGSTLIGSATSGFDGSFTFPTLTYDSAGVHQYTVREVVGERTDVNYDGHTEAVSVTVSDNVDGTLTASTSTDADGVVFNNTMKRGSLTVTKAVEGTEDRSKMFHFEVDLNGAVESFSLKGGESKTFADLPFGTRFEVNEVDLPVGYSLTSLSNKSGVIGPDTPTVTATALNTYSTKGSVQLGGQKVVNGRDHLPPVDGEFSFQLLNPDGEVIQTVSNADGGSFVFDAFPVTSPGDSTFIIREVPGSAEGMTYDTHEEKVVVSAVDDGVGNLSTSVKYDADGAVFVNEYKPPTLPDLGEGGPSTVSISKELVGSDSDREFELTVNIVDNQGADFRYSLPWTSSVDPMKSGSIQNGGTLLIRGGETLTITGVPAGLTFTVKESTPAGYTVHPDSVLTGETVGGEEVALKVINVYEASGELLLKGSKELFGGDVSGYSFNFVLMKGEELVQRVSNDESGSILFKPLYFTTEDIGKTYHYLVAEEAGNDRNIGYDQTVFKFDVKVEDNGDGTLKLSSTLDKDIVFMNVYAVQGRFPASGSVAVGVLAALGGGAALALWFARGRRVKAKPRH